MKNFAKTILVLTTSLFLASCNNVNWSWWSEDNIEIVSGIAKEDAQSAVLSAENNYNYYKTMNSSTTLNTYYLDYLGSFASEQDANTTISSTIEAHRYTNNIKVITTNSTTESNYKTAHAVSSYTWLDYFVAFETTSINETSVYDYGYGTPTVEQITRTYNELTMSVGTNTIYSLIDWDNNATYGYAQNNEVLVETYSTVVGATYQITYTGAQVPIVTNNYRLYRFNPITLEDGSTSYALDYSIETQEVTVGYDIFYGLDNASHSLSEPITLLYQRTVTSYSATENGAFDTSVIPVASE